MDDLTITRLCAESMGFKPATFYGDNFVIRKRNAITNKLNSYCHRYNPLHNKAQMAELIEALSLQIDPDGVPARQWRVGCWIQHEIDWIYEEDSNLSRAVCLCAAKYQQAKETGKHE